MRVRSASRSSKRASDDASFSTGSEFIADGGLLLGPVPNSSARAEAAIATA